VTLRASRIHTEQMKQPSPGHQSDGIAARTPVPGLSPPARQPSTRRETYTALLALLAILAHILLRYVFRTEPMAWRFPLYVSLATGGGPLVWDLARKVWSRDFGSDLLAGISILASVCLGEYLVGVIVVLMLSGGNALEHYATRRASFALRALAKRMPQAAHRKRGHSVVDIALGDIAVGDTLVVFPHEICPVDGVVTEGHGAMDEAYLTGEPYVISKAPGSEVMSGAINGDSVLTIRAIRLPVDSRYVSIMKVMQMSEHSRPRLRRLGDEIGAWYTPLAVGIAGLSWLISGSAERFLAVMVIATPCPLLIAIPVVVIGAISLAARRGIVVKNPAALEQIDSCSTLIFDKTGTLTYGRPTISEVICAPGFTRDQILIMAASLEQYSKHPLAGALLSAAENRRVALQTADEITEKPGEGLRGIVEGREIHITGRAKVTRIALPPATGGLECVIFVNGVFAGLCRFRDEPRAEGHSFINHLKPRHQVRRVVMLSGDRESEVRYLAESVGINEIHASKSPEEKVAIVREATRLAKTLFVGDGINDAPALLAATVGVGFGIQSDVTTEAADVVIMEQSLGKVDELMHIARRMRHLALESAVGGMAVSVVGMLFAAAGYLLPIYGAIAQEFIDLIAVLNALRMSLPAGKLTDF
jgi:heavy metal translocating P-type ATPase